MTKRALETNYFADDKDIYDLLASAKQKLTSARLVEFARKRHIILSPNDDRDSLIERIAQLPFGWSELNELISMTDSAERNERISSRTLSGAESAEDIGEALAVLKDDRQNRGEGYTIQRSGDTIRVGIAYSELDTSRTRLAQRTQREFALEIEVSKMGETTVRHQDQPRAHDIVSNLLQILASKPDSKVQETRIEVTGIRDVAKRTSFFLKLIHGVDGYKFDDVKAVKASPLKPDAATDAITDALDLADSEEEEEESSKEISIAEAAFVTHVKDIALKGERILDSNQYTQLQTDGFFVRSIVWTAIPKDQGPRIEFYAGFDNPDEGTGFTYAIRGVYPRRSDGEFRKSKATADIVDRTKLLRLIEAAARKALATVSCEPQPAKPLP